MPLGRVIYRSCRGSVWNFSLAALIRRRGQALWPGAKLSGDNESFERSLSLPWNLEVQIERFTINPLGVILCNSHSLLTWLQTPRSFAKSTASRSKVRKELKRLEGELKQLVNFVDSARSRFNLAKCDSFLCLFVLLTAIRWETLKLFSSEERKKIARQIYSSYDFELS